MPQTDNLFAERSSDTGMPSSLSDVHFGAQTISDHLIEGAAGQNSGEHGKGNLQFFTDDATG